MKIQIEFDEDRIKVLGQNIYVPNERLPYLDKIKDEIGYNIVSHMIKLGYITFSETESTYSDGIVLGSKITILLPKPESNE